MKNSTKIVYKNFFYDPLIFASILENSTKIINTLIVEKNIRDTSIVQVLIKEITGEFLFFCKKIEEPQPAVEIKESVQKEHLVCLEDGVKVKSLKNHLKKIHKITPLQYKKKWNLPIDYPMVHETFSSVRRSIAYNTKKVNNKSRKTEKETSKESAKKPVL